MDKDPSSQEGEGGLPEDTKILANEAENFDPERAKEAARLQRIMMRRRTVETQLKTIREFVHPRDLMDAEDRVCTDFVREQGDDLIEDEKLREEWDQKVVCPGKEGWEHRVYAVYVAVGAMETLTSYKAMGKSREDAFKEARKKIDTRELEPHEQLTAARLVARFSKEGQEFAEYAGIADLNDTDSEGYWKMIKLDDWTVREPSFDDSKLPTE